MDISEYIRPILKWWRLLVVVTGLAAIASIISVQFQPAVYESRTTLMIGRTVTNLNPDSGQIYIAQQLASIYADMASREPVKVATMKALGINWLPSYQVRVVPNTQLIEITVVDSNPQRAQIIADTIANQVISQSPALNDSTTGQRQEFIKQQLSSLELQISDTSKQVDDLQQNLASLKSASQIAHSEDQINQLTDKLNKLRDSYANLLANSQEGALNILSVFEPANLPTSTVGTNKILIIILASLVGLVLSTGAAYLLEYLDRTIKTTRDVERIFNIPVIGYLSLMSEEGNHAQHVLDYPNSLVTESFRLLQSNLEFFQVYNSAKTILVTSPTQGNGKTTIAVNLALSLGMSGQKTILVDSDLRRPAVHAALGVDRSPGLSDLIRTKGVKPAQVTNQLSDKNIDLITAGQIPPNVTEVIGSKKIAEVLNLLKEDYETIVVDAPPLVISDSYNLASKVDGVILVLEQGQTREEQARVMKEQLNRASARVIGVVFNRVTEVNAKSYGDYQYLSTFSPQHYNDYVSGDTRPREEQAAAPTKKLLAFFERGEVPPDVTASLEGAFEKFQEQRQGLRSRFRKPPKQVTDQSKISEQPPK